MRDGSSLLINSPTGNATITGSTFDTGSEATPERGLNICQKIDGAVTSTSTGTIILTIQESADDSAWVTIATFPTLATSTTALYSEVTRKVFSKKRYIRAVSTVTGTYTATTIPTQVSVVMASVT